MVAQCSGEQQDRNSQDANRNKKTLRFVRDEMASQGDLRQAGSRNAAAGAAALGPVAVKRTPPDVGRKKHRKGTVEEREQQRVEGRRLRYKRQRHASWLLRNERRKDRNGQDAPYRITSCLWCVNEFFGGMVTVRKTTLGASLTGLLTCASVWMCPVCGSRIANERANWIRRVIAAAESGAAGGVKYRTMFYTLTASHDKDTDLKEHLRRMTKAHEDMWRGAAVKRAKERFGILGHLRNLEVTHSERWGWHDHIHGLVWIPMDADREGFERWMRERWYRVAVKHGLGVNEHGFEITDSTERVSDYLAKFGHMPAWDDADELARWHQKTGKRRKWTDHYTPWQLLEFSVGGDKRAGELFVEYANAFYRRRQLFPSKGLYTALGIDPKEELTDEQIIEQESKEAQLLAQVQLLEEEWRRVRHSPEIDMETGEVLRYVDRRCELLEVVEQVALEQLVEECRRRFNIEVEVHLPEEAPEPELEDEEAARLLNLAELVAQLKSQPGQRVMSPAGAGYVGTVIYVEALSRWRASVNVGQPDERGVTWRYFDVTEVRIAGGE